MQIQVNEVWRDCVGIPDYQVSSLGRVRSLDRIVPVNHPTAGFLEKHMRGRSMTSRNNGHGYSMVCIRGVSMSVHRLVATAFIPNPENKPQTNHKNGIRTDNRVENLEWATQEENIQHSRKVLGQSIGESHYCARLTESDILDIRSVYAFGARISDIGKAYDYDISNVWAIVNRRIWRHI